MENSGPAEGDSLTPSDWTAANWARDQARHWIFVLGHASRREPIAGSAGFRIDRDVALVLYGSHMAALALQHLWKCLNIMTTRSRGQIPEEVLDAIGRFNRAYARAKVAKLRNALEHEEEKISRAISEDNLRFPLSPPPIGGPSTGRRFTKYTVLGEEYDLTEVFDRAFELDALLVDIEFSLQD